MAQTFDDV